MKVENTTTGHTRMVRITDIPGDMPELVISIGYHTFPNEGGAVHEAVTLDNLVIPAILNALNAHHQLAEFFKGLKREPNPEEGTVTVSDDD